MAKQKKTVAISLLGTTLDHGFNVRRWERWRPTVALAQQPDLALDRLVLLFPPDQEGLARRVETDVREVSPGSTVELIPFPLTDPWNLEEVYRALYDFARAYPFRVEEERYLIHITTGTHVAQICLFLLTEARYLPGELIQTAPRRFSGATRPQNDSIGSHEIIDLDLSRYDALAQRFREERRESLAFLKSGIETKSAQFNRMIEEIEHVALHSNAPILLTGPTGAGKSRLARRIYELKKQRNLVQGENVEINCATLRGETAISTLFGHVRGAFTGAERDRPGLLRRADRGLLFLDEVGELGLDEQACLLRAIEEQRFLPVGADQEQKVEFLLIAGTNRDLGERVAAGAFREDLLARIDLWTFRLPALIERREDIEPNLDFELEAASRKFGRNLTINREARTHFLRFATAPGALWRGNFRELSAAVTRMGTFAPGGRIDLATVQGEVARLEAGWAKQNGPRADGPESAIATLLEALGPLDPFDRVQLAEVVRICRTTRTLSEAGRQLFAASRAQKKSQNDGDRLRKYLARFGLDWELVTGKY